MQLVHLKSPKGWINDPNGFIYYQGQYHLFYQCFPYDVQWGRMHWGHAVSKDLTSWEHLGIALFPSKLDDSDGCFSGSAIEHNGRLNLFYTGVRYLTPNPENTNTCLNDGFVSAQLAIHSSDGFRFDNFNAKTTIIPPIEDTTIGSEVHTRDPKVWQGSDGSWYMVLGSSVERSGRLLFYKSENLKDWHYMNHATVPNCGWMWECPDYFKVGNSEVLIFSPMGLKDGEQTLCTTVSFDETTCTMDIPKGGFQYFDYGLDLYAPQSTVDSQGRRVVVAWLRMPKPIDSTSIGMFCIPRVCEVVEGHIYFRPHPNVKAMFTKEVSKPMGGCYSFNATLKDGDTIDVGGYLIGFKGGKVYTDRSAVMGGTDGKSYSETPTLKNGSNVQVYVDTNIVEVFVNGGEYVITNYVYGLGDSITSSTQENITLFTI